MSSANSDTNSIFVDSSDSKFKYKNASDTVKLFTNERVLKKMFSAEIRLLIKQLQDRAVAMTADGGEFADAYSDANGQLGSVDTQLTTAEYNIADQDKYMTTVLSETVYVEFEADSILGTGYFTSGTGCNLIKSDSSNKWLLYATSGTDAEKRAKMYKVLFYGSNGTDPRVTPTYITNLTALKTSVARDVGKRGIYAYCYKNSTQGGSDTIGTGTFSDTTTNTYCSAWSKVASNNRDYNGDSDVDTYTNFYIPESTLVNGILVYGDTLGSVDELGTDTEGDETSNPTAMKFAFINGFNGGSAGPWNPSVKIMCLSTGAVSWNVTNAALSTDTDFYIDYGVPLMTAAGTSLGEYEYYNIVMDIPSGSFSATISSCIGSPLIEDWETGADINYKLTSSAGDDTGWLPYNEISKFTAFTAQPNLLTVKLISKEDSPTEAYPSINGFGVVEL